MLSLFKTTILNVRFCSRPVFCKDKLNITEGRGLVVSGVLRAAHSAPGPPGQSCHTLPDGWACMLASLTRVESVPSFGSLGAQCDLLPSVPSRVLQATGPLVMQPSCMNAGFSIHPPPWPVPQHHPRSIVFYSYSAPVIFPP